MQEESNEGMELEIGAILDGKVTGITTFGAFVALPGGRSGLVHISEVAHSYVNDVNEVLSVGQEVKVKLIRVDENNRINLSIKQTQPSPPRQERQQRQNDRGARSRDRGERADRPQSRGGHSNRAAAPKEPQSFEDMMKRYMSESESRQSELNRGNRGSRGRRRGGNRGSYNHYDD